MGGAWCRPSARRGLMMKHDGETSPALPLQISRMVLIRLIRLKDLAKISRNKRFRTQSESRNPLFAAPAIASLLPPPFPATFRLTSIASIRYGEGTTAATDTTFHDHEASRHSGRMCHIFGDDNMRRRRWIFDRRCQLQSR